MASMSFADSPFVMLPTSADAWASAQLPPEVLRDGELLAQAYLAHLTDEAPADRSTLLEAYEQLKAQRVQAPSTGTFAGDDLDRLRLFAFPTQPRSFQESFDAVTPSAVLREAALTTPSPATIDQALEAFQTRFCLKKTMAQLGRAMTPDVTSIETPSPYLVSAHDQSVFPEKLFSLSSSRFQLDMLAYFRLKEPALFASGMHTIVGSILDCPPLSLCAIRPHSAEAALLAAHVAFGAQLLNDAAGDPIATGYALSLLLALGESSGHLQPLLVATSYLLRPANASVVAALPTDQSAHLDAILRRLDAYKVQFELSLVVADAVLKSVHVLDDDAPNDNDKIFSTLATDGKYVYGWSTGHGLQKVGSGYHGAVAGKVYAHAPASSVAEILFASDDDSIHWSDYTVSLLAAGDSVYLGVARKRPTDDDPSTTPALTLWALDASTLTPTARVDVATTATTVFTDGHSLFTAAVHGAELVLERLVRTEGFAVATTWHVALSADAQAFFRKSSDAMYYTNGHAVVVTQRGSPMPSLQLQLESDAPQVVLSHHDADVDACALVFDARNNVVWRAMHDHDGNILVSHQNHGLHVAPPPVVSPTPSAVAHRVVAHLSRVLDAYAGDTTYRARHVPFLVDLSPKTFELLLILVAETTEASVLETALRLLLRNVQHWHADQTRSQDVGALVGASGLVAILQRLVDAAPTPSVLTAAQALSVATLELSHPTLTSQWTYALSLLSAAVHGTLPVSQQPALHLVLAQLTSHPKMQAFAKEGIVTSSAWSSLLDLVAHQSQASPESFAYSLTAPLTSLVVASCHAAVGAYANAWLDLDGLVTLARQLLDTAARMCDHTSTPSKELEAGVVGQAVGVVVAFVQAALETTAPPGLATIDAYVASIAALVPKLSALTATEDETPARTLQVTDAVGTLESAHPNVANTQINTSFVLPGASTMTISFDPRSATEGYYNSITFYTDESCAAYHGEERYYGHGDSTMFPGIGSTPPLQIPTNKCFVVFRTMENAGTFFGYRFTAVAKDTRHVVSLSVPRHLLSALSATLGSIATKAWSTWSPTEASEVEHESLLQTPLFRGGLRAESPVAFLHELIELPEGSPAETVAKLLKAKTIQDQGAVPYINRAVRAVAAALLHHNGVTMDAIALSQGLRSDASAALLKAWRNAQKMRHWLHLGDAKPATESKPTLKRQPSAYAGASDEALQVLCANVVARARFLLTLEPATLLEDDGSATKRRWGALAKLARSHTPDANASLMTKWHALIDEAKAATDLKALLSYRKSAAGRDPTAKTTTELVLGFVQSDASVADVSSTIAVRNARALLRGVGLDALHAVVATKTGVSPAVVLDQFASTLQASAAPTVQLTRSLEGSDVLGRVRVRSAFSAVVGRLASALTPPSDEALLVASLKLLAMDFEPRDVEYLTPDLVTLVFDLLLSLRPTVRHAAQATIRLWCDCFLGADVARSSPLTPLLVSLLQNYTALATSTLLAADADRRPMHLARGMHHVPLELVAHNVFALHFALFCEALPIRLLKMGDRVTRGPQWNLFGDDALGMGVVGTVAKLDGTAAAVQWRTGDGVLGESGEASATTKFFHYSDAAQEIVPLDRDASGLVCAFENETTEVCRLHINLAGCFELQIGADVVATSGAPVPASLWHRVVVTRQESSLQVLLNDDVVLSHVLHDAALSVVFGQTRLLQQKPAAAFVSMHADTPPSTEAPKDGELDVGLHLMSTLLSTATSAPQVLKPQSTLQHVVQLAYAAQSPVAIRVAALHVLSSLPDVATVAPALAAVVASSDVLGYTLSVLGTLLYPDSKAETPAFCLADHDALWLASAYARFARLYAAQTALLPELADGIVKSLRCLERFGEAHEHEKRAVLASMALLGGLHDTLVLGGTVKYKALGDPKSIVRGVCIALDLMQSTACVLPEGDHAKLEYVLLDDVAADATPPVHDDVTPLIAALDAPLLLQGLHALLSMRCELPLWVLDVRARALKALERIGLGIGGVEALVPQWLALARAPPAGQMPPSKRQTLTFQSGHPYANSIDVYQTICVEGATGLRVTFDERCRTEHDYDYVKFYKDDSYNEIWGETQYTGRDGSENWAGFGGRPPLEIPTNKCVLYWHTDGSGNDWGWLVQIEAIFDKKEAKTSAASSSSWSLDQLQQRAFHLSDLLHQHNVSPNTLAPALPAPIDDTLPETWQVSPKYFYPAASTAYMAAIDVTLHASPDVTSDVVTVVPKHGPLTLLASDGRWVHVATEDADGWTQARDDDTFYVLPATAPLARTNTSMLNAVAEPYVIGPVTGLLKPSADDDMGADELEAHFVLKTKPSDKTLVPLALGDVLHNLSAQYARKCLQAVCLATTDGVSAPVFLELCDLFVFERDPERPDAKFAAQLRHLARQHESFRCDVVARSVRQLDAAVAQLPTSSVVNYVHIEKTPPLGQRRVHFPGASRLRIVFREDDTNVTNPDDALRFYHPNGTLLGQYTGAKDSGVWPGIGSVPPLEVDGDTLIFVNYVPSFADTGSHAFKVYAEGFYLTPEDPPVFDASVLEGRIRLCCWVLQVLAESDLLLASLVANATLVTTLELLGHVYQLLPPSHQVRVLDALCGLLRSKVSATRLLQALSTAQIQALHAFVHTKLLLRHDIDKHYGDDRSPLMHRLVQCALAWDTQLASYLQTLAVDDDVRWLTPDGTGATTVTAAATEPPTLVQTTRGYVSGLHTWEITVHGCVDVGVATDGVVAASVPATDADVVSVELDIAHQVVTFRRNRALVCRNELPSSMQPWFPAVLLAAPGDAATIRARSLLADAISLDHVDPWYADVRSAMAMVDTVAAGTPSSAVALTPSSDVVHVPGAKTLQLVPQTDSGAHVPGGVTVVDALGATTTFSATDLHAAVPSPASALPLYTKVVRGSDWQYGDEDGGAGNAGVVVGTAPWNGVPDAGVRIFWRKTAFQGLYRHNYLGTFDVLPLSPLTKAIVAGPSLTIAPTSPTPSMALDGRHEIVLSDLPSLHDECTLQFWLRVTPIDSDRTRQCIFQLGAADDAWHLRLELNAKRQLVLGMASAKLEGPTLPEATWIRIEVGTCGSLLALHVDGALSSHERFGEKLDWRDAGASTLVFGRPFAGPTPSDAFVGHVAAIHVYDAPLHLKSYAAANVFSDVWETNGMAPLPPPSFDALLAQAAETTEDVPPEATLLAQLETRNAGTSFPSLRPKGVGITEASAHTKIYYEMTLLDGNANQIGWSFGDVTFTGCGTSTTGVGDVEHSYAIDLNRMVLWHGDKQEIDVVAWTAGDVLGVLLDTEACVMTFSVNGVLLQDVSFQRDDDDDESWLSHGPVYPSVSLSTNEGVLWNIGHLPFRHCPESYVSVLTAADAPTDRIAFEIFDLERQAWHDVGFWHRVQPGCRPRLVGTCLSSIDACDVPSPIYPIGDLHIVPASATLGVLPSDASPAELAELVRYINQLCASKGWTKRELLDLGWANVAPKSDDELVKWPLLHQSAASLPTHFALLQALNLRMDAHLLLYVGVEYTGGAHVPALLHSLMACRDYMYGLVKQGLWDREMAATAIPGTSKTLVLNRPKAARHLGGGLNPFALFLQAHQGLKSYKPAEFCASSRLYTVTFLGENAIDVGGPYRETFSQFAAELQSAQLPLLLPTPNHVHNVGNNRDAYVLHPTVSPSLLIFLGKLLGVAMRSKEYLALNLSQVVWKLLTHETLTIDDLEAIDSLVVSSMNSIRRIDSDGVDANSFEDVIQETFATLSTDNRTVPIVPGGDAIAVTFENRGAFADGVETYRLHEFDAAAKFLREGLGLVVPLQVLRLFSWREVEMMVCGSPAIDMDLLKECTEYSCCEPTDAHVKWFWEVLCDDFSEESKRMFLKFTWGRIRLPRSKAEFGQLFKLQNNARDPPDTYLPVSHTCFFSLELPKYSSKAILTQRLMYAIYNCHAIDGDGDALAANQLGWED
ncbi:hypothetical protein SDRG_05200 [Saprolegnia diclina VS20]|uniref:HECT domain-containing protein n=1 Tax=Saprolegnia diclina (strain VS20) TaxID=1156394 RepID=T0QSD1_SAPDV|nr:hypothetical protein SDRG_05200 [Saprolegnia diclina VS20]EQC37606.1 hypothetical protein SDRG_05200 [Saprolegnia diclina VS20]|eukprot:XP_008609126.1 hypothetical protein SDRG_05200 [Saprolegnia diclina VS20]